MPRVGGDRRDRLRSRKYMHNDNNEGGLDKMLYCCPATPASANLLNEIYQLCQTESSFFPPLSLGETLSLYISLVPSYPHHMCACRVEIVPKTNTFDSSKLSKNKRIFCTRCHTISLSLHPNISVTRLSFCIFPLFWLVFA